MKKLIGVFVAVFGISTAVAHVVMASEWRELPSWIWEAEEITPMTTFETFAKWPLITSKIVVKGQMGPASAVVVNCADHTFAVNDGEIKQFVNNSVGDVLCQGAFAQKGM